MGFPVETEGFVSTETLLPLWGLVNDRGRIVGVEFETPRDEREFFFRGRWLGLREGDEVLVDVSAYGVEGDPERWCKVTRLASGTAAVYPIKVAVPERGTGQYAAREILGWRRPEHIHAAIREGEWWFAVKSGSFPEGRDDGA